MHSQYQVRLRFEAGITGEQFHVDRYLEHRIVLPMVPTVVALEKASANRETSSCHTGQVQIIVTQFDV